MVTTTYSPTAPLLCSTGVFTDSGFELLEKPKELPLAINFRDLAESDPSRIKPRQVYRSSEMFKMELISAYSIKTLVDMRKQDGEKELHPVYCTLESKKVSPSDVKALHFNLISTSVGLGILSKMPRKIWWELLKGKMAGCKSCQIMCPAVADPSCFGFSQFYKILIDKAYDVIANLLRVFANKDNYPIVMHCTHGKDRTGILAFLLQAICEVSLEDIKNDYALSETKLREAKAKYPLPIDPSLTLDSVLSADPQNMVELSEHINHHYGSLMGYLAFIGLTMDEVDSIRSNLMRS